LVTKKPSVWVIFNAKYKFKLAYFNIARCLRRTIPLRKVLHAKFVALQLKHVHVLVRIVENGIHVSAVYMMLLQAADDDSIFYISII
jgi:hypothetical protein